MRLVCVRGRDFLRDFVESVDPSDILAWDQVAINIDCDLDAPMPHLLLEYIGEDASPGSAEIRKCDASRGTEICVDRLAQALAPHVARINPLNKYASHGSIGTRFEEALVPVYSLGRRY